MLSDIERVDYYMGANTKRKGTYQVSNELVPKCKEDCKRDDISLYLNWQEHLSSRKYDNNDYWFTDLTTKEGDLSLWKDDQYKTRVFPFRWGDRLDPCSEPTLTKVRWLGGDKDEENANKCIWKIERPRHWGEMFHGCVANRMKKAMIPFHKKIPMIGWRGASTGGKRFWQDRGKFVKTHFDNPICDIGINWIARDQYQNWSPEDIAFLESKKKPPQSMMQQLRYKYVVSIEGNDKASDLNWKLASNSVVFMKPPSVESWLMEGKLQPWIHYVPLADDFSNLNIVYRWAESHPAECLQIIRNANIWMSQFLDFDREKRIMEMVMKRFLDNVNTEIV